MPTASAAIAAGTIPAPPALTDAMVADAVPVSTATRYEGEPDGPILLIDGDEIFELLDEIDNAGTARLAAERNGTWYRTGGDGFLTWTYRGGAWMLEPVDQYLA